MFWLVLYSSKEYIVKLFKNKFLLTGITIEKAFKSELVINRSILKHYGNKAEDYLTITPVKGFKNIALNTDYGIKSYLMELQYLVQ